MQIAPIVVFVGALVFIAHLFEKIFEETKVPDVLLLILLGVIIGPILKIVEVSDFGLVGPVFVTLALVVILFQGGTKLRLPTLSDAAGGTLRLTVVSFTLAVVATALFSFYLTDLGVVRSIMLGAFVGGTSSAIVIPLVRELKMRDEAGAVLQLESALSDVLAIVLGLALLDAYQIGEISFFFVAERVLTSFSLAALFGLLAGILWSILLKKIRHIEDSIFTTPAFVFIVYGVTDLLGYSGAIAALAFGITLGNVQALKLPLLSRHMPIEPVSLSKREASFFSGLVFLIKTFFFVFMGISILLENLTLVVIGLGLSFVMLIVRVVAVKLARFKEFSSEDVAIMSAMIPKGLAAAVLASIPFQLGVPGGDIIQNITYAVILFSITLTSITVFIVEKKLAPSRPANKIEEV